MWGMCRNAFTVSQVCTLTSQKTSLQLHNWAFCLNRHPRCWSVLLLFCVLLVLDSYAGTVDTLFMKSAFSLANLCTIIIFSAERILFNQIKWVKVWAAASHRHATAKQKAGLVKWAQKQLPVSLAMGIYSLIGTYVPVS